MKNKENKRNVVRWLVVVSMVVFLLEAITPILSTTAKSEKAEQVSERTLTTDVLDKTITPQPSKAKNDVKDSTTTWSVDNIETLNASGNFTA